MENNGKKKTKETKQHNDWLIAAKCNALTGAVEDRFFPKGGYKIIKPLPQRLILHVGSVLHQVILVTNERFVTHNPTWDTNGFIQTSVSGDFQL